MVIVTEKNIIHIIKTPEDLFILAAKDFATRAHSAIAEKGEFTVVLSGGNTPKGLFNALVEYKSYKDKIAWNKIKFFFGDERYVSSDNKASNYYMAFHSLFSKVPIDPNNIYRIPIEFGYANDVAKRYDKILHNISGIQDHPFPKFDLVYLGLGEDAHTASLMPMNELVAQYCQYQYKNADGLTHLPWVASVWHPKEGIYQRITLTPPAINHAAAVVFLVTGVNKAGAISKVLAGPINPILYPAQLIHCLNSKTVWFLDDAAASALGAIDISTMLDKNH